MKKWLATLLILPWGLGLIFVHAANNAVKGKNHNCRTSAKTAAEEVCPVLTGTQIPAVTLQNPEGQSVDLLKQIQKKPTILVFYRGGWCMYCNRHFSNLAEIEDQILELGWQIIAVSPDKPEELQKSIAGHKMKYTLLSDSSAAGAKAFGLAFQLDDETLKKYKTYGIDLEQASGFDHNILPVPAVFLVDTKGKISFQYVNPDYSIRLDGNLLLAAINTQTKKK